MKHRPRKSPTRRTPRFEALESRRLLAADWQNPGQPLDVNNDLEVVPNDILLGINRLNRFGPGELGARPADATLPFYDTNGDGSHTSNDILIGVNALNSLRPLIAARLTTDTAPLGATNYDWISSNPALTVNVSPNNVASLRAGFAGTAPESFTDVTAALQDGRFEIDETLLAAIHGQALEDGEFTIQFQAIDSSGATSLITGFDLTLDRTGPTAMVELQETERVTFDSITVRFDEAVDASTFAPAKFALQVEGGTADGQAVPIVQVASASSDHWAILELAERLPDQSYRLQGVSDVFDLAGNTGSIGAHPFTIADPTGIAEVSPADGESMVTVTREAIVRFDEPVDPATVTASAFQVLANGEPVAGRIVVSRTERFATFFYDEPLPASTEVRVTVNGDLILGRDGLPLDADGDHEPGGRLTADFRTLPLTRIAGTELFGFVRDSQTQVPLAGVTISLDAFPSIRATTDANGFFELGTEDVDGDGISDGLPAPEFFVHIDGSTASTTDGRSYASLGKPFHSVPGQRTQLEKNGEVFDIFLPSVANDAMVPITAGQDTEVGFGATDRATLQGMFPDVDPAMFAAMRVMIPADSAMNDAGQPASEAFVVPVDPDFLPAPLPPNLTPSLVVSIQTPGATNFDVPASATFPNLDGMAPGEQLLLFSFDHDAGEFVVNGTATVSADGMGVVSDPGVGINAPGWHFVFSGSQNFDLLTPNNGDKDWSTREIDGPVALAAVAAAEVSLLLPLGGTIAGIGGLAIAEFLGFANDNFVTTALHLAHFLDNTGVGIRHGLGTNASMLAMEDENVVNNHERILREIKRELDARVASGSDDTSIELVLARGAANVRFAKPDLFFAFGGTQGVSVEGEVSIIDGRYVGSVRYVYADTYGYGRDDANSFAWPDRPARLLQEYGVARPFRAEIEVEFPIDLPAPTPPDGEGPARLRFAGGVSAAEGEALPRSEIAGFGADHRIFYRFVMDNGVEISGATSDLGRLDGVVLPPGREYVAYFYQPSTNLSTVTTGQSARSGSGFGFVGDPSSVPLDNFGGVDLDQDGLPDVGELAIGTDPDSSDTDGDGITDAAEIAQGLDPLGGRVFPTGIVASLPLRGSASGVVSVGAPSNPEARTVYVATGTHGLAVVDSTQFDNPIVQGQLDLPGDNVDVAVDAMNALALVASTVGVHRVDVSDPMAPVLVETLDLLGGSKAVAVFGETIYAGNGNTVVSFDTKTGERIDTISLGATEVTGLTREGSILFAMQANGTLSSLDVTTFDIRRLDSLPLSGAGGQLFAGNGIVYVAGVTTGQGGYLTVDVSDPADLRLLADEGIPSGTVIPGQAIVANGSGLGVLIGSGGGGHFLELMDASDPTSNFNRTGIVFPLPEAPRGLALGGGLAFVANGGAGLQVLNMLPFDANGAPPAVNLVAPADADAGADGIQVVEGSTIPLRVDATDDVQVRNVELLIDGQPIENSLAFPWNLTIPPQTFAPGADNQLTVQVRAIDTGGNASLSDPLMLHVIPDTISPTVVSQTPADGSVRTLAFRTVRIAFNELMDVATLTAANVRLLPAGGDAAIQPTDLVIRDDGLSLQITYPELVPGNYLLELQADALTDRAGNALGAGVQTTMFTIIDSQLPEIQLVDPGDVILGANDDNSTGVIDLGFTLDFFGRTFESIYINNNGNVTFDNSLSAFTAEGFPQDQPIIAPFWADVDTRGNGSGVVHFNQGVNERGNAFVQVTWDRVGYFSGQTDKLNDFTLYIEDDAAGDIVAFVYRDMQWTTGSASGGDDGFGGSPAQIGFDSGDGENFLSLLRPSTAEEMADLSNRDFVFRLTEEFLGSEPF